MKIIKEWGWEYIPVNNELYCLKLIFCENNIWSSGGLYHMHAVKDETFFVVDGELEIDIDGESKIYKVMNNVRITPLTPHRFRSKWCQFLEVSTPDKPEDSIRGSREDLHYRIRQYRETSRTSSTGILWN